MNKYGKSQEKMTRAWSPKARKQDGNNRLASAISKYGKRNGEHGKVDTLRKDEPNKWVSGRFAVITSATLLRNIKDKIDNDRNEIEAKKHKCLEPDEYIDKKLFGTGGITRVLDKELTSRVETRQLEVKDPNGFKKYSQDGYRVSITKEG